MTLLVAANILVCVIVVVALVVASVSFYRCTHKESNIKRAVKRTRKDHPEYDPVRICAA